MNMLKNKEGRERRNGLGREGGRKEERVEGRKPEGRSSRPVVNQMLDLLDKAF